MRSWRTRGRSRERILCFGVQGTGKSHAALTIMQRCPADTFYIIDNDNAWDRQIEQTELEDMVREEYRGSETHTARGGLPVTTLLRDSEYENPEGNIVLYHCDGWAENVAAIKDASERCGRHDWIVIDSMTMLWDDVQKAFIEGVFDSEVDRYFLQVRMEKEKQKDSGDKKKSLGVLEGWMDWPVINAMWKENVAKYILNPPGHLFMTAEIDTISKEADSEIKGLFGPYGVKPKGQKRTGHNPQTVMLMTVSRQGDWKMTTVKDRGQREKVVQEPVEEFAKDYLFKIAGWRATDVKMEEAS